MAPFSLPWGSHRPSTGKVKQLNKRYKPGGFYWERELYQSEAFLSLKRNTMKLIIALLDAREREPAGKAKTKKGAGRKQKFINLGRLRNAGQEVYQNHRFDSLPPC